LLRRTFALAALLAVSLTSAPPAKRVVSLSAPLAETLYAIGARDRLIAVSDVAVFPEQLVADRKSGRVKDLGPFMKPDLELLKQLRPDLILSDTGFQRALTATLEEEGFKVMHFEPESLEDIFQQMIAVGEAVGRKKQAGKLVRDMRAERDAIAAKTRLLPKVKVYVEVNHEGPWTTGGKSALNDLLEAAGGQNIFADREEGVFVTTNDEIVSRNPDVILSPIWRDAKVGGIDGIIPLAQIVQRPGYASIAAVQNSRVLYYDSALVKHEGPRQILAIRKLAHILHPEVFPDPPGTIPWELGRIQP
jgi:iron complex transport system substrate-binding protein